MYVRKFIEAVLDYTRADKIYVIGHSMGVTLARKAI
jgi:triacylglycerol esterase/lipase EstA (alpha/beta hydrolase family)